MKRLDILAISLVLLVTAVPTRLWAFEGFDYSKHSIPVEEIQSGGPRKDGIPSLVNPEFIPADEATFLEDSDKVIGVSVRGEAKAYPIKILNWHEAVNDTLGGKPILATW
jgi:hypothetical protein